MSDEWYTPKEIFDALGTTFDLDPCSPPAGSVVPAKHKYVLPTDGLTQPWFGRVWCNPPYSKPEPWVDRWIEHENGLLLVSTSKAKWFRRLWASKAIAIQIEPPRFIRPSGKREQISYAIMLWAIGEECTELLRNSGLGKVR